MKRKTRRALLMITGTVVIVISWKLIEMFSPLTVFNINRWLWRKISPNNYYMEISEIWPHGTYQWSVTVEAGATTESILIESVYAEDQQVNSWFTDNEISINRVFDFVEVECVSRGYLNCGVTYDFWYRYPKKIDSYQRAKVTIDLFEIR